jgi:flagellar basal body-associated protein FliL
MGRYEQYRRTNTKPRNKLKAVRRIILIVFILLTIAGFIVQIVMNL